MKYVILTILFPPIFSQFVADLGMKPDVTFDDHNDRFDMTSFFQQQNSYINENIQSDEEFRRSNPRNLKSRRSDINNEFAYHDEMVSGEGGTAADFEDNLNKFKMQNRRARRLVDYLHGEVGKWRRSGSGPGVRNSEMDILMHYAVPIEMTVEGYLKAPLEE